MAVQYVQRISTCERNFSSQEFKKDGAYRIDVCAVIDSSLETPRLLRCNVSDIEQLMIG